MNAMNKEIKERQSPKVLGEATALRKLVGGLSESRNKLEQELTKAGKEAPPPQKPIPSREKIVALTQAIKKDPKNWKLIQKLANLYISYEFYEEAIKPLKFAIKLHPITPEGLCGASVPSWRYLLQGPALSGIPGAVEPGCSAEPEICQSAL